MAHLLQDVRHALRIVRRHPGYFGTALLTLALGIGFNTAIFTVVNAVLLRPLPYPDPDRLVLIRERRLPQFPEFSVSPGNFLAWQAGSTSFAAMAAYRATPVNVEAAGELERMRADRVTGRFFDVLAVKAHVGRTIVEADDRADAPAVAVLSYVRWQRQFGGEPGVVGRVVRLGGTPRTIVGVMPPGFAYPSPETAFWLPMVFEDSERQRHGSHYLSAIGRLRPDVTLERAEQELRVIARALADAHPDSNQGWEPLTFPLHEYMVRNLRSALLMLVGAVCLVLLIACVNVANLLLARGASRQKEMAIRGALGARRGRLVRQVVAENLLLGVAGAAGGLVMAAWLLRALGTMVPASVAGMNATALDRDVLLFTVALSLLTPLIFGIVPALFASRADLRSLIAVGGRQGSSGAGGRLRGALVVAEIALALMLVVGAGLLVRSFNQIRHVATGYDPSHVVTASVSLTTGSYPANEQRVAFFRRLAERTQALPQVQAAGVTQTVPLVSDYVASLEIDGRPPASLADRPSTNFYAVSPGYFAAMGIPVLRGRGLTDEDRAGTPRVVVVNETLARRFFPGEDPTQHRIRVSQGPSNEFARIVGVVADVKQYELTEESAAQVYESYLQHPYFTSMTVVARVRGVDPAAIAPDLRAIVRDLDRNQALARVRTMDEIVEGSMGPQRFSAVLLTIFGAAALLLAAVGLYGVLAYAVGQRRQEFAVRIAHGARPSDILRLVLRSGLALTALGVALGVVGAFLLRQLVAAMLFGVAPTDPLSFAAGAATLTLVALAASAIPAWRATRVDPVVALRE